MKPLRRMSAKEARLVARKLAAAFLEKARPNGFAGVLQEPMPDQQAERHGKVCRYWTAVVEWRKGDCAMDGASIIQADLLDQVAEWRTW
ncbi:MAG: hypothetical protein ACO1TE_11945 [Prosthecobacter sp.]